LSLIWSSITNSNNSNDFVKPCYTPTIMLLIKDLYKPCFALCLWSDDLLLTWPSSTFKVTVRKLLCKFHFSLYCNIPSLTSTVTPAGITIGFLPILDILSSFISIQTNYQHLIVLLFSSHQTFDVETIAILIHWILGMVEELEYLRKPGLLILWISLITDSLVSLSYFKAIWLNPEQRCLQICNLRYNLDQIRSLWFLFYD
jgi:hypothetical protein